MINKDEDRKAEGNKEDRKYAIGGGKMEGREGREGETHLGRVPRTSVLLLEVASESASASSSSVSESGGSSSATCAPAGDGDRGDGDEE
jgi:hypothetical protein